MRGLGWLGIRTDRFDATVQPYRDLIGLEPYHADERSVGSRLADATKIHVYGPAGREHGNGYELISRSGIGSSA